MSFRSLCFVPTCSESRVLKREWSFRAQSEMLSTSVFLWISACIRDNYTFFRLLMDDHRQDSLSADNKDLCDVIMVKNVSDARTVMPFYYFGELLYSIATKIHDKIYYSLRNLRGDANNTLLVYLMKKLYNPIFRHHDRITKYYTVYTANLRIEDAMQKEVLTEKGKYYICMKKTYSDRFATDGLKQFYHQKALNKFFACA